MSQKRPYDHRDDVSVEESPLKRRVLFKQDAPKDTEARVVCAMDFGTAFTGYAFAFTNDPDDIDVCTPGGQDAGKTNTSLLLDPGGNFLAFGSEARKDYYMHEGTGGMLFEKFKMRLHDTHNGAEPYAQALNGQRQPLLKVITLSLKYVKEEAMVKINRGQVDPVSALEIKWMVTVPAIWRDAAKVIPGMMRKAAFDAGMISDQNSDKLGLCLEPEAACMACEDQKKSGKGPQSLNSLHLKLEDTFMVLDCGGGTVDITVHRVEGIDPLRLSEVCQPSGGPWGSTFVDEGFEQFLQKLVGPESWERFKPSSEWVDVMEAWEKTKHQFDPSEKSDVPANSERITMTPLALFLGVDTLKACVDRYNLAYGSSLEYNKRGYLMISVLQMQTFFTKVISKIVAHVKDLIIENPVSYVYLVGGFAESKMLQMRVKVDLQAANPGLHVIVPTRPQLMVVKGAVIFGLQKGNAIMSRVSRSTYGYGSLIRYDASNPDHTRRGKKKHDGKAYVNVKHFYSFVEHGSKIQVLDTHTRGGRCPASVNQKHITFKLFSALPRDPDGPPLKFVDEPGVTYIGKVSVPCLHGETSEIAISFGNTEIKAKATNEKTGQVCHADIQYDFNSL